MKKDTVQLIIISVVLLALLAGIVYFLHDFDAKTIFEWYKDHISYSIILLLMAVESSFIPFPSEVVVPPAAYFALRNGDLNVVSIVLAATAGAWIGATINYLLSMWLGRPIVYGFADSRLGHMCLIDRGKVERAEDYFDRHGAISTFLGRLIPAIRQLISIPAGLARMNFFKFSLFTVLGAGIWNSVLAALGWWLSTKYPEDQLFEAIERNNHYLTLAGVGLLVLIVLYLAYQAFKKKPVNEPKTDQE